MLVLMLAKISKILKKKVEKSFKNRYFSLIQRDFTDKKPRHHVEAFEFLNVSAVCVFM